MTDYKTIRGKKVKFFETDLSSGEAEGQLFFSDTSKEMKIGVSSSAWHSEAPLITARQASGGIGTQTANLAVGGYVTAESTLVEEYSGSSWAAGGALPAGRQSGGALEHKLLVFMQVEEYHQTQQLVILHKNMMVLHGQMVVI